MPYQVKKKGNSWVVVKKDGGQVVAGNKTKLNHDQAIAAMKARLANE